jgi:hypothetical protein
MKKLLITTALVLSTILLHGQDNTKYKVSVGTMIGAPYDSNFGGWISVGDVGFEYSQGTVNSQKLFPTPTKFTNVGVNIYYLKKIIIGGGLQILNSINDNSASPYILLGTNYYFGNNDMFVLRGELNGGAKGITTLSIGLGLNL